VAADAYRLPFAPGLFDAATMIRVLHHMADAPRALAQIRLVLRPGGSFILEFANKQNLKAILRYALRRQDWSPYTPEPVEFAALNFDFHPAAVQRWLKASGFSVRRQLTVSHFRFGPLKRLAPLGLLVKLDALAQRTGDWWQLSPSVFVLAEALGGDGVGVGSAVPGEGFFRCPACEHYPLEQTDGVLPCPSCGRQWEFRDGIYNFKESR
jgi:SAM-dependent methyltransferase